MVESGVDALADFPKEKYAEMRLICTNFSEAEINVCANSYAFRMSASKSFDEQIALEVSLNFEVYSLAPDGSGGRGALLERFRCRQCLVAGCLV